MAWLLQAAPAVVAGGARAAPVARRPHTRCPLAPRCAPPPDPDQAKNRAAFATRVGFFEFRHALLPKKSLGAWAPSPGALDAAASLQRSSIPHTSNLVRTAVRRLSALGDACGSEPEFKAREQGRVPRAAPVVAAEVAFRVHRR